MDEAACEQGCCRVPNHLPSQAESGIVRCGSPLRGEHQEPWEMLRQRGRLHAQVLRDSQVIWPADLNRTDPSCLTSHGSWCSHSSPVRYVPHQAGSSRPLRRRAVEKLNGPAPEWQRSVSTAPELFRSSLPRRVRRLARRRRSAVSPANRYPAV